MEIGSWWLWLERVRDRDRVARRVHHGSQEIVQPVGAAGDLEGRRYGLSNLSQPFKEIDPMAAFVDSTVTEIDNRLRELKDEVSRLEAARVALVGNGRARPEGAARATGRPRRSATVGRGAPRRTSRRGPDRPLGRRGGRTRSRQALELVRGKPGITIRELAEAMKIEPNYLYRVMPKLVSEGQVKRDGQGWRAA
jgi:Winged helix-turn-helix DNA-binding